MGPTILRWRGFRGPGGRVGRPLRAGIIGRWGAWDRFAPTLVAIAPDHADRTSASCMKRCARKLPISKKGMATDECAPMPSDPRPRWEMETSGSIPARIEVPTILKGWTDSPGHKFHMISSGPYYSKGHSRRAEAGYSRIAVEVPALSFQSIERTRESCMQRSPVDRYCRVNSSHDNEG